MTFHLVLSRPTDLAAADLGAGQGLNPRHSMAALAEELDGIVHDGTGIRPSTMDRLLGRITRLRPLWWAMARSLRNQVRPGDVIYCSGEDVGVPVATLCGGLTGVHVTMMTHYVDRLKGHVALRLFRMRMKVSLFFTVSKPQADFLCRFLKLSSDRVIFVWDQTDTEFFSPGPQSTDKRRPLVMSVGLEQRDYSTLAAATHDLDVDVRISGYSADTSVLARALPAEMPENMIQKFYSWPDLQQLYRDADVVVVSLFPNKHAAGVQALMEGLACGRPVVIADSAGLVGYLDEPNTLRRVPVGDASAMRLAITELLANPDEATAMSSRALALARSRFLLSAYVTSISSALRSLNAKENCR